MYEIVRFFVVSLFGVVGSGGGGGGGGGDGGGSFFFCDLGLATKRCRKWMV